jgi:hypothetical protein
MCGHYYLIGLRPSEDYNTWSDIETIDLGNALRLTPQEHEQAQTKARQIAADYAVAYPELAGEIFISYGNCNGIDDVVQPYRDCLPPQAIDKQTQRLAKENVRLRAALAMYGQKHLWKMKSVEKDGGYVFELPIAKDGGDIARTTLTSLEEDHA